MERTEEHVVAADGVRLHCETLGHGPRTVLVPNGTYLLEELLPLAVQRRMVFFDPRNRGRSDAVPGGGILQDVEDTLAVAAHFSDAPVDLLGHSFAGLLVALCAKAHPDGVGRVVQVGPMGFVPDREYPASLANRDDTFTRVMRSLGALLTKRPQYEPEAFCEAVWAVLRPLYVTNEADAHRIDWGRCSLPNERNGLRYFNEITLPSIRQLALSPEALGAVTAPVLVVHGTKDRSSPYGAGREWAMALPNARLLAVEGAGHAPWVEAPDLVLDAIETFLRGEWPAASVRLKPEARSPKPEA